MSRAFAPGRVNLIGEHTDYNDGLCLPFAIERGVTVSAERLTGRRYEVEARELGERDEFSAGDPPPADGWRGARRPGAGGSAGAPPRPPMAGAPSRAGRLPSSAPPGTTCSPRASRSR